MSLRPPSKYLCDDIIVQILSRLPAKDVARCRSVCRVWKAMTTTRDFVELHHKRSIPTIIIERMTYDRDVQPEEIATDIVHTKVYLVDSIFEAEESKTRTMRIISENVRKNKYSAPGKKSVTSFSATDNRVFCFCGEGLIVFKEHDSPTLEVCKFIILNPITQEQVTIFTMAQGPIYGIFLHPLAKDENHYCLLFGGMIGSCFQFHVVDLGGSPSQTPPPIINYDVDDVDGSVIFYEPGRDFGQESYDVVNVDDVMYWMVAFCHRRDSSSSEVTTSRPCCKKSIMAFDIKAQKFSMIPHPGPQSQGQWYCKGYSNHRRMHLAGMDGILCLCEVSSIAPLINIWISKEEQNGGEDCYYVTNKRFVWIKWRTANIDIDICHYPFNLSNTTDDDDDDIVPASAIINGELLLPWLYRGGLFAFNLKLGTVRRLVTKIEHEVYSRMCTHIPSLPPITNRQGSNQEICVELYSNYPLSSGEQFT